MLLGRSKLVCTVHLAFDPNFDVGIGTFYPKKFRQAYCIFFNYICTIRNRKTSTSSLNGSTVSGSPQISDKSRNSDALALGTASGSVLIFSLKSGDVSVHLAKKNAPHKDQVNGIVSSSIRDSRVDRYFLLFQGF